MAEPHVVEATLGAHRRRLLTVIESVVRSVDLVPEVVREGDHVDRLTDGAVVPPGARSNDAHSSILTESTSQHRLVPRNRVGCASDVPRPHGGPSEPLTHKRAVQRFRGSDVVVLSRRSA